MIKVLVLGYVLVPLWDTENKLNFLTAHCNVFYGKGKRLKTKFNDFDNEYRPEITTNR